MAKLLVIVAIMMSCGCATTYQRVGFGGGYSETQLDENVFTVNFRGNGYTSMEKASDFALLRCAELTLSHGYRYFSVVDNKSFVISSTHSTPTTSTTTGSATISGNTVQGTARTTTTGGQVYTVSKPTNANTIVCFQERPEGMLSYDAQFTLNSISAKYGITLSPSNSGQEVETPGYLRSGLPGRDAFSQGPSKQGVVRDSEEHRKFSFALKGSGLGWLIGGGLGLANTHRRAIQWGIMGMTTGAMVGGVIGKATNRSPMKVGVVPLQGGGFLMVAMDW